MLHNMQMYWLVELCMQIPYDTMQIAILSRLPDDLTLLNTSVATAKS